MRRLGANLVLGIGLVCGACDAPGLSVGAGQGGWADPGWSPPYRPERDAWRTLPGYGSSGLDRHDLVCDRLGRCWPLGPSDRYARRGYLERRDGRPPGWAESLPGSAWRHDRFVRPRSSVVCDQATSICYKDGRIDKSETEHAFGERAGDRADSVRDRLGTGRAFVPQRGVACDRLRQVCWDDGQRDRSLTRRYFGRRAARDLDDEQARDDGTPPIRQRPGRKRP
jgi:hypothetical protein